MADKGRDPDFAFIDSMSDAEMRDALVWLRGYTPAGFAGVKARTIRLREDQAQADDDEGGA